MVGPVLVVERLDHVAPLTPAVVFERHADVPDLRPPPGQFEPELLQGRAMLVLECHERVAGPDRCPRLRRGSARTNVAMISPGSMSGESP